MFLWFFGHKLVKKVLFGFLDFKFLTDVGFFGRKSSDIPIENVMAMIRK